MNLLDFLILGVPDPWGPLLFQKRIECDFGVFSSFRQRDELLGANYSTLDIPN